MNTTTVNAMMKTKARGAATPMKSKLHSEPTVVLPDKNHSPGQQTRITRSAQIASKSNQITRVDIL